MFAALTAQWRTLRALVVRDLMMRYGRDNIGFGWVVLEPMILCTGITLFWAMAKPPFLNGIHIVAFVITGYMPLTLFRHCTNCTIHILSANKGSFMHRQVTSLDVIISRSVMEILGATIAFVVIYGVLLVAGAVEPIRDYRLVLAGWLTMAWLGFGVGVAFAVLTEMSRTAHHFVGPFQYITVPLSPTFYMLDWLPAQVQDLMYYNPLAHPYEMIRGGFFGPDVQPMYDPMVPLTVGLVLIAVSFLAIEKVKERIHDH
jgi:capsular polysaccharide transport system permease protein